MESSKTSMEKLKSGNYDSWSFKMQSLLINLDLWDYVEGDAPTPNVKEATSTAPEEILNSAEIKAWKKGDSKAKANIVLCVENSQLVLIKDQETSKKSWKALKDHHFKNTITNKASVLKELCTKRLSEGGNAETHLLEMEELFQRLANLGKDLEEDMKVILVLQSLPDSYRPLAAALEARNENDWSIVLVKAKISEHYNRIKGNDMEKAMKMAVKDTRYSFNCNYCREEGHIKRNCPRLKEKEENQKLTQNTHRTMLCQVNQTSQSQVQENFQKTMKDAKLKNSLFAL